MSEIVKYHQETNEIALFRGESGARTFWWIAKKSQLCRNAMGFPDFLFLDGFFESEEAGMKKLEKIALHPF